MEEGEGGVEGEVVTEVGMEGVAPIPVEGERGGVAVVVGVTREVPLRVEVWEVVRVALGDWEVVEVTEAEGVEEGERVPPHALARPGETVRVGVWE